MRADSDTLRVVLMWHLHQPDYRDPLDGSFRAPWSYLHALKDYTDMAAHLETQPGACAVINFTPVLVDQLQDYRRRLEAPEGTRIGDDLLDALRQPLLAPEEDGRRALIHQCLQAQRRRMIERHEPLRRLVEVAELALREARVLDYLDEGFVADLLVWYHVAWLGESVRSQTPLVARLMEHEHRFSAHDRQELLTLIRRTLSDLLPRYAALARDGRVELTTTPYTHPILPLLLDLTSAAECRPDLPLPLTRQYPGGEQRVQLQLAQARARHREVFSLEADGCWPSEGAVSAATLSAIGAAGFRWTASSQAVLRHSLDGDDLGSEQLHRPYRLHPAGPVCFFRDDELSDLIGFTYKDWGAGEAVADLVRRLEHVAAEPGAGPGRVVLIALDGENAWEHYPANGAAFLQKLYHQLAAHPRLSLTTPSRCIEEGVPVRQLKRMVAGSWVYGDLATWIGSEDKNRAWELLVEAKHAFDACSTPDARAVGQLAVCEGSDWFWWPGEYNPEGNVATFERLFRIHLAGLYRLLGREVPTHLAHAFTHGAHISGETATMRPQR